MMVTMLPGCRGRSLLTRFAALALAVLAMLAPSGAAAGPALVFDVRSGEVLHAHEPFAKWYPASLTKMMTAYVAFRAIRQGRSSWTPP
jgi:D-alanyl-D-alanine carboxypeptidase